jgi:predicted RNA methylase
MNPPFGTRNVGIDTVFVSKGMDYSNVVYSLHKTSTREVNISRCFCAHSCFSFDFLLFLFLLLSFPSSSSQHFFRFAESHDYHIEVIAELKYDIPKTHKFHKEKSKDIFVDLYRFSHKK